MQAFNRLSIYIALLLSWQMASAQVPVVEAGGGNTRGQSVSQPSSTNDSQNDVMINMYLQLEALQNEVQNLRGLVEEQSYQIRRMQTEQRDRYLDTDARLVELQNEIRGGDDSRPPVISQSATAGPAGQGPAGGQTTLPQVTAGAVQGAGNATATAQIPRTEQDIYRQALALLLEQEKYQDSITLFQQYIDIYPQGRYFTNALYWQGAAFELTGNYNSAIEVLQRLINNYPTDAKAPTALLRLGTVYREMGRTQEAIDTWRQISQKYPESTSEIEIARDYLSEAGSI